MSSFSIYASRVSAPIFLEGKFYNTGHTESTLNATVTFVKFEDNLYLVTCKHVIDAICKDDRIENNFTLRLNFENIDLDFSTFLFDGKKNGVMCPTFNIVQGNDLAILKIDRDFFDLVASKKKKAYIDLDDFKTPPVVQGNIVIACGWADEHKRHDSGILHTPMVEINIEINHDYNPTEDIFSMHSRMEQEEVFYYSGVSGGPVFFIDEHDTIFPIGIIYEGLPGSGRGTSAEQISLFDRHEKMLKAYTLTPEKFYNWIVTSKPSYQHFSSFYKGYSPSSEDVTKDSHGVTWFAENMAAKIVAKRPRPIY